jgi:hypothetical protein
VCVRAYVCVCVCLRAFSADKKRYNRNTNTTEDAQIAQFTPVIRNSHKRNSFTVNNFVYIIIGREGGSVMYAVRCGIECFCRKL